MNETKTLKIGITGATGFVGSYIIRELLNNNFRRIVALKRKGSDFDLVEDIADQIDWKEGDILNIPSLDLAFGDVDILIHAAAIVSFNADDKSSMRRVNIEGTSNIVNLAIDRNIKKLIHISSVAAIGRNKVLKEISEDSKWEEDALNSVYAKSKRHAELEVWRGYAEGLPITIFNPSIILGAGYWENGSAALIPKIINGLPFYPKGKTGFVDVRDVALAVRKAISADINGERIILNADNLSYKKLFEIVCNATGQAPPTKALPNWLHPLFSISAKISSWFTGDKPIVTSTSLRLSAQKIRYKSQKAEELLGLNYRPIDQTIKETTQTYLDALEENKKHSILNLA
jgi:nucleoside-diphosphate-sugar epimerase